MSRHRYWSECYEFITIGGPAGNSCRVRERLIVSSTPIFVLSRFKLRYYVSKAGSDCGFREFQCQSDKKCIPSVWRCNQNRECEDGSDERDCSQAMYSHPASKRGSSRSIRGSDMFEETPLRKNSKPINQSINQPANQPTKKIQGDSFHNSFYRYRFPGRWVWCDLDHILCGMHSKECFATSQRCNGVRDCSNGFDEDQCPPGSNYVLCKNFIGNATRCGSTQYCYDQAAQSCDGSVRQALSAFPWPY